MVKCEYSELVDIHKIVVNPKNPNKHTPEQIDRLAKIIDFQGQRSPIIVSKRSGFIVAGHGRLEAMKKLGWEKVAVDYQDFKDEAEEYAHMTADNAIAAWAELDLDLVIGDIKDFGFDFDNDLLGLKDLNIAPVENDVATEKEIRDDLNKKFILEITFPNEMELADIRDDLISRGYIVKEKNK